MSKNSVATDTAAPPTIQANACQVNRRRTARRCFGLFATPLITRMLEWDSRLRRDRDPDRVQSRRAVRKRIGRVSVLDRATSVGGSHHQRERAAAGVPLGAPDPPGELRDKWVKVSRTPRGAGG